MSCSESKGQQANEFSLPGDGQPFILLRPSADCMSPTHMMAGNLLYLV